MENKNLLTILIILVIGAGAYYFLVGKKATSGVTPVVPLTDEQAKGLTDLQIQSLSLDQINAMSLDQLGLLSLGQGALLQARKTTLTAQKAIDDKIVSDKAAADAAAAKKIADAAIEAQRISDLKTKMSAYTMADIDKLTASQLKLFTTEELQYLDVIVKSEYDADTAKYLAQQNQTLGTNTFKTALLNLTATDKANCTTMARKIYDDTNWSMGIFEGAHSWPLYQDFLALPDAQFYYLVNTSWATYNNGSLLNRINAQKEMWAPIKGQIISRIQNFPTI